MKFTRSLRFVLPIATTLLGGGLLRAQDANSSWLLQAPLVTTSRNLDLSAARIVRRQSQSPWAYSQTSDPDNSASRTAPTRDRRPVVYDEPAEHRFWDTTNDLLFAGVGASRTLDYLSTLNMRRRGRDEIFLTNDVVDNHAAFAAIEAAGTGASIGLAYLFHRYGHHKLERATSIVHIGLATTGAVRNYSLRTAHPATSAPASAMLPVASGIVPIAGPH